VTPPASAPARPAEPAADGRHLARRFLARRKPQTTPVTLRFGRIFLLPTRAGLVFAGLLLVMLLGAVNYGNSLGFAFTFLLGSLALVSLLHTYRNLAGLQVSAGRAQGVFPGDAAQFPVHLRDLRGHTRYALALEHADAPPRHVDLRPNGTAELAVPVAATRRGLLRPGRVLVSTRFPLGLVRAWSWLELGTSCPVYPTPAPPGPTPEAHGSAGRTGILREGDEDFAGLRGYAPGDSPRQIAWKALAREQGLLTKQFAAPAGELLWLDWDALPGLPTEERLSRLCRAVLDAHGDGKAYGLRLPGRSVRPATGEAHLAASLEALALFGCDTPAGSTP
jgi:uncharacterized protein (DUF58 family)